MHVPLQPLMRSLLSQFLTPADSSQSSRFFRVWKLVESPLRADHPAYFGLAKLLISPTLSAVDESEVKALNEKSQCRFLVQTRVFCGDFAMFAKC